ISWRKKWLLTPVFLPGEFHGQRISASAKGNNASSSLQNSETAPVNQIQEAISDNYVMIFPKTFCSYSTMVNMLFHDLNVNYKVVGLDMLEYRSQIQDVLYKVTSERSALKIFVNGTFIESAIDTYRLHREEKLFLLFHQFIFFKVKQPCRE
uniref:Glutaredoxin domain-containing protein n=1 Tax=Moschus moschiferus TaxID=68415 RepID=A0A8C6DCK0_MOSMO